MDWMDEAACGGKPIALWFPCFFDENGIDIPDDGQIGLIVGDTTWAYGEARKICNACPVKSECLDHALDERERYGMWGGLTPLERLRIERRARRARRRARLASENAVHGKVSL
jgi:WhiB family transcriptional regulator, redox-sensing transcriptional regulator